MVPALRKRRFSTDHGEHAPHSRGHIRFVDIEFDVRRKLSAVAGGAKVVGALHTRPTHGGEYRPGPHSLISGHLTTRAGNAAMVVIWRGKTQQFGHGVRAGLMDRRANGHLGSFQIQLTGAPPVGKNPLQLKFYLAGSFFADRGRRFFSSGARTSSAGRARQIFSLTCSNSWHNWRKR